MRTLQQIPERLALSVVRLVELALIAEQCYSVQGRSELSLSVFAKQRMKARVFDLMVFVAIDFELSSTTFA
jgi:hypothetical protein